jgi:hypothetical protein
VESCWRARKYHSGDFLVRLLDLKGDGHYRYESFLLTLLYHAHSNRWKVPKVGRQLGVTILQSISPQTAQNSTAHCIPRIVNSDSKNLRLISVTDSCGRTGGRLQEDSRCRGFPNPQGWFPLDTHTPSPRHRLSTVANSTFLERSSRGWSEEL